jgi:hypothetical protein
MSTEQVSVQELDKLMEQLFDAKVEAKRIEAQLSEQNKEIGSLRAKITSALKELGREDYKTPVGTFRLQTKWRVGLPQTAEDKAAFFSWLRDKGIFDQYATVNSNSLNSLYMREWEAAKERGEGMEFSIPGVPLPKAFETVGEYASRKKK